MDSPVLLSALVLNYRSPRETIACVESLLTQTIASEMEILIIDNHSDDESIGWLRARYSGHSSVHIIEMSQNYGYGRANTMAASFARGEYLFIVNPDNTLTPRVLEQMIDVMKSDPSIGILAPELRYSNGGLRPSARQFPTLFQLLFKRFSPRMWQRKYDDFEETLQGDLVDTDWLVGTCLLVSRTFFLEIGGFDPRFFLFFEDVDLCRTVHQKGKRVVYLRTVSVLDKPERLSGGSFLSLLRRKTTWIHFVSAVRYFWKWGFGFI